MDTATAALPVSMPLELAWGLQPPPNTPLAWGARAIYQLGSHEEKFFGNGKRRKSPKTVTTASIDLLYDRQGTARDESTTSEADAKALSTWLNNVGLPKLRQLCVSEYLTGDSDDTVEFASDGYAIKASPRGSYGYLYIVAWVTL